MAERDGKRGSPDKSKKSSSSTLATTVYDRIRGDIVTGVLSPDKKLRTEELRGLYDAGNSPIREALNRLSSDGFVVREEQRGFHVASVRKAELLELVKTRCWLEETALRQSITDGDDAWEERLVIAHYRLSKVPPFTETDSLARKQEWESRHQDFHMCLISECGSRWLLGYCQQLQDQAFRYRQLVATTQVFSQDRSGEHTAIFQATIDRDADSAVNLLKSHYMRTARFIENTDAEIKD